MKQVKNEAKRVYMLRPSKFEIVLKNQQTTTSKSYIEDEKEKSQIFNRSSHGHGDLVLQLIIFCLTIYCTIIF